MKKKIFIAVLMVLFLGLFTDSYGQGGKKKKKKAKTTDVAAPVDSGAKAPVTVAPEVKSEVPAEPVAPRIITLGDSTRINLDNLVSDSSVNFIDNYVIDTSRPSDGFYKTSTLRGAKPFPFPDEKVNNIKKYKRLWREINLQDSANKIFAVPGETLMQSIMDAIKAGQLIAYSDPEFRKTMTYEQAIGKFRDSISSPIIDTSTGLQIGMKRVLSEFIPDSVTKFEIKEDIYFDKVRGRVVTEIISLAPKKRYVNSAGVVTDIETHPFYLYFKQLRKLLASREVTDLPRDISNVSYDDMFISRNFRSKIVMEASPSGLSIKEKYKTEEEQIREANRIEKEIKDFKRGLFKYY